MKRTALLVYAALAAAFGLVVCVFLLEPVGEHSSVEFEIEANTAAKVQLFYDRGAGIREEDSAIQSVVANRRYALQFALPPGTYHRFRLDPLDRRGTATISRVAVLSATGRVIQTFSLTASAANKDLVLRSVDHGVAQIESIGFDPSFELPLHEPVMLTATPKDYLVANGRRFVWVTVVAWAALLLIEMIRPRFDWQGMLRWPSRYPRAALAGLAAVTALLACHPLLFGDSLLSPNFHIALLYPDAPAVPGVQGNRITDAQGGDVGAMFWQHMPYAVMQHDALAQGELPLWNRYGSCGTTLFGQGQSMFGDPLHLLVVAARGAAWAFDLKFILLHALFCCGAGWTIWAIKRDWAASALTTISAGFVGFFIFRINHPAIFTVCYAPWIVWAWAGLVKASSRPAALMAATWLFAANWMVATSGTVKEATMLAASLNAVGAIALLLTRDKRLRIKIPILALVGMAFALATMPIWLTFADTLIRARTFSDQAAAWRLPARLMVAVFDDLFYRELDSSHRIVCPSANLLVLTGALWCLGQPRRWRDDPFTLPLLVTACGAIAVAFDVAPTSWILAVPGVRNVVSLHNVFSCVAIVSMILLSGCGFAHARAYLNEPQRRDFLAIAVLIGAPIILLWYYFSQAPALWHANATIGGWLQKFPEHAYFYTCVAIMASALVILHVIARKWVITRTVSWPTTVASGIALLPLLAQHGLQLPLGFREGYFLSPPGRADLAVSSPTIDRLKQETAVTPYRFGPIGPVVMPDYAALHGLETYFCPDALVNRQYDELLVSSSVGTASDWMWALDGNDLVAKHAMLDLLNVKFCVAQHGEIAAPAGFRLVSASDLDIFENASAWPRAFFTTRVIPYRAAPDVVALAREHPGQPFAAVLESNLAQIPSTIVRGTAVDLGASSAAAGYRLTPNSTSFTVHASGPGMIVLQEAWLKGDFKVAVNGQPTSYLRVNHAFKGVPVTSAGDYHVTFTYWPRYLTLALWACLTGFTIIGAMVVLAIRGMTPPGGLPRDAEIALPVAPNET